MFIIEAERAQGKKNLRRLERKVHTAEPESTSFSGICERRRRGTAGMKKRIDKTA